MFKNLIFERAKVNKIADEKYSIYYNAAVLTTIIKHILLVMIIVTYASLRYAQSPVQNVFRYIYPSWILVCIVIMLIHLSIIFYQMNKLIKQSQQQSVKNAQKRVSQIFRSLIFSFSLHLWLF